MNYFRALFLTILSLSIILSCSTESTPVYQLTTSSNPTEGGTVSPAQGEYDEGEKVNISATPNEGWAFQQWQGDQSGSVNPVTVEINSDKSITALFVKKEYPLTINTDGEGTVNEKIIQTKSTDYVHGTTVELNAVPSQGWQFVEWQGDLTGNENPIQLTIEEEKEVTAVFSRIDYELTININGEGEVDEEIVQSKSTSYPYQTEVMLTALADEGWEFSSWNGDLNGSENPISIIIDQEKNVTANFSLKEFQVNTETDGNGSIQLSPNSDTYQYGEKVEFEAIPDEGWFFDHWEGDLSGTQNPDSLTIDNTKSVTAVFRQPELQLWRCDDFFGCDDDFREPDQVSLPYSSSSISVISTTSNAVVVGRFFLRAIGKPYTVTNVKANDQGGVTSASFNGIENGTVINPGQDIEFSLMSGKTGGQTTVINYSFQIKNESLSFSYQVQLQTN